MIRLNNISVFDIIKDYLSKNHYDGLVNCEIECGCGLEDICPCGCPSNDCIPGYLADCTNCANQDCYGFEYLQEGVDYFVADKDCGKRIDW